MIDYNKCRSTLTSPELDVLWDSILEDYPEGSSESRGELLAWIDGIRSETVELLDDIVQIDASALHLALRLIELRSQWTMFNTRLNFKMMKGEPYDAPMATRGSLVSSVTHVIEGALAKEDVEAITRFLGDPAPLGSHATVAG